jgi:AcrR family transcriptional regulator
MVINMAMDEHLSRRERKKRETRRRLMRAALRLFRDQGYDATTVEQIAETADVAKGTFFNYFETKEAILPALAEWRLRQLEGVLSPTRGAPASPVARIKLALCLIADDPLADPLLTRRLFAAVMPHVLPHRQEQDAHPGRALARLLADQVRQAQSAGEIRADVDSFYVGSVIRTLFFQQLMMWHCGYCSAPLPELLDRMVDLLLDGIAGPRWRQAS